jgi:hypothetical protein
MSYTIFVLSRPSCINRDVKFAFNLQKLHINIKSLLNYFSRKPLVGEFSGFITY